MTAQKGRDFILKTSDGQEPENFAALGAARTNRLVINNNPVDATTMQDEGIQTLIGDAGVQTMEISIDGLSVFNLYAVVFSRTFLNNRWSGARIVIY